MKKLAIIPAYNEKQSIIFTVEDIKKNAPDFDYIIINDCSTDNTMDICKYNGYNVLNLPINLGIGGAVQTGYLYAYNHGYDVAVQFDGDGQHKAEYLNEMTDCLVENQLDMVIGSRFINNEGFQSTWIRRIGIKYFTILIKVLSGKVITDPTSGMRICNRKTIEMFANEYPRDYPEPESVMRLIRHKRKIAEISVEMRDRQGGVSFISPMRSVYYMVKVTLAVLIERMR